MQGVAYPFFVGWYTGLLCFKNQKENEKSIVKNENKDGYSASVSGANIGKKTILVDYYETVLTERNNAMYYVINKAIKKVAMRGFVKSIDRMADDLLSKIGEFEKLMKDKSEDSDK